MSKIIKIPWAVWRDPAQIELKFPDLWDIENCRMIGADGPVLTDKEIKQAILNPIGTSKLKELAKGKEQVVIVVDDMTRTTPVPRIMPWVIKELHDAGVKDDQITFLLAIGAHRPMNKPDCYLKLGKQITDTYRIENHHPYENLTNLGESSHGTPKLVKFS